MTIPEIPRRAAAALLVAAALVACDRQVAAPEPDRGDAATLDDIPMLSNSPLARSRYILCKTGSWADFQYTTSTSTDGVNFSAPQTFTIHLENGECAEILNTTEFPYGIVEVTETGAEPGFELDRIATRTTGDVNFVDQVRVVRGVNTVLDTIFHSTTPTGMRNKKTTFINLPGDDPPPPPPPPSLPGRMTGGGNLQLGDIKITRGFTIHCDITLSNNIEINWPGYRWHLDKPITSAYCLDDPAHDEEHPVAGFDTFIGAGVGRLNGVDGSRLEFIFVDSGEPGGSNDIAGFQIWDADNNLVLDVPAQFLTKGNVQAHEDQPHRNK